MAKPNVRLPVRSKKKKQQPSQRNTRLGGFLRGAGNMGGAALGSLIGMPALGAGYGTDIGASLSRWLGSGDYSVSSNSLVDKFKSSGQIPMMHQQGQSIIVRHREYITDVLSGADSGFGVLNTFALNPGVANTFPWLSTVAQNFQEYTFKGVVFHYTPTSGNYSTASQALGTVMMSTDYRSTSLTPANKQFLLNEYFSSDSIPSSAFCHPIECDPKENPFNVQYVRTGAVPVGEDVKTYDLGRTNLAVQGVPGALVNLGELWVSYEVELRKPIALGISQYDSAYFTSVQSGIVSSSAALGTISANGAGDLITSVSGNHIVLKRMTGTVLIQLSYVATGITGMSPITETYTNCSLVAVEYPIFAAVTTPGGYFTRIYRIYIPSSTSIASVDLPASIGGSPTAMLLAAFQVNDLAVGH